MRHKVASVSWSSSILACAVVILLSIVFASDSSTGGYALAAELGAPKPGAGGQVAATPTPTLTSDPVAVVPSPTAKRKGPPATSTPAPATPQPGQTVTPSRTPTTQPSSTPVTPGVTTSPAATPQASPAPTVSATPITGAKSNDDFDGATPVSSLPFSGTQDTTGATSSADDPDMRAGAGLNSNTVWFKIVPASPGGLTVSTVGSDYDTVVAVFTGQRGGLNFVISNDDAYSSTVHSEVAFNVQAGTAYYVEVAQYGDPAGGLLRLSASLGAAIVRTSTPTVTPTATLWPTMTPWPTLTPWPTATITPTAVAGPAPANDNITSATNVGSLPFSATQDTTGATSASDDPEMGSDLGRNANTVWFKFSAASAGSVRVSTSGSNYDTVLAVFSGLPGSLVLVGSNDDVANNTTTYNGTSEVVFNALAGSSYYVEVAQYGEPGGGQLRITMDGTIGLILAPSSTITSATPVVAGFAPVRAPRSVIRDSRYFASTGFRIDNDSFYDYFNKRGGVRTFGYPVSWEFDLLGFKVQFFQRGVLQKMPNGSVASMNLLDDGIMPYTRINSSVFPSAEEELIDGSPSPADPEYGARAIAFLNQYVPDEWNGVQVNFLKTFQSTVRYEDAFPEGDGNPALVPLLNLELFGLPTSKPAYDPANHNFIYQRFQRGILHYDVTTGATQGLLLADYLKSIMTGQNLPADLESQARSSRFYRQYAPGKPGQVARPQQLPDSNMTGAFEQSSP